MSTDQSDTSETEATAAMTTYDDLSEEEQEILASQQVDMRMRQLLEGALGKNIHGAEKEGYPDYYEIFSWDKNPGTKDYYALALRNPFAYAVTFLPASTAWRDPPKVVDDVEGSDGETQFENDVEEVVREQDLWDYGKRVDKLAGIGNFGCLVLEFDDIEDPTDFDQPVSNPENLTGLKPFSRMSIQGVELGGPGSGRWGEPEYYEIDLRDENDEEYAVRQTSDSLETTQGGPKTIRVHYSRVIHVHSDELLDDEFRGVPRQQPVYNNLIDIEKTLGSAGELAYRASAWGLNINIDKDFNIEDNGDQMREQLHAWEVGLENVLRTHGADEVQSLGGEEINPSNIIDPNIEAICSYLGISQSVLKGNETGERATSEDLKEWYGKIQERRQEFVTPTIVRELINRLVEYGIVEAPVEGAHSYSVEWEPLAEMSAKDRAEVRHTNAQTLDEWPFAEEYLTPEQQKEFVENNELPSELDTAELPPLDEESEEVQAQWQSQQSDD